MLASFDWLKYKRDHWADPVALRDLLRMGDRGACVVPQEYQGDIVARIYELERMATD